jgi:hypothetical protein
MRAMLGFVAVFILMGGIADIASSRIELVTLPPREIVRIRFPQVGGEALVQERRTVTLKKGENLVEFSWSNLTIDPRWVHITPMPREGEVEISSISIRPGSAKGLIWHVRSSDAMELLVYITYFLEGITWSPGYTLIVDREGKTAKLICQGEVANSTPEEFRDVQVEFPFGRSARISLKSRESRMVELIEAENVPVSKLYIFDSSRGEATSVYYVFKNDEAHNLGKTELPSGRTHLYRAEEDGLVFLSEDILPQSPIGGEVKLKLGGTKEVEVKKELLDRRRVNIRRTADQRRIALCDIEERFKITAQNHRKEKVKLEIYVRLNDEWEVRESSHRYEKEDSSTVKFTLQMEPGEKKVINLRVLGKNIIGGQIRPVVM